MAKLGDYFGDGGAEATNPPKGSMEWAEQQGGGNDTPQMKDPPPPKGTQERVEQDATQADTTPPVKGTQEWAEQNSGENAPVTAPVTQQQQPPAEPPSDSQENGGELSYAEMWKKLNPYEPPTPEQLEKERKKKKRDQIWAAVGDGIAALSNLFFTSQYAPNAYTGRTTMSDAVKDRWDKLEKDRKDNAINYFNGYLRAKAADDADDKDKRNWEYRLGRDKLEDERAEAAEARAAAKDKRDAAMHELNLMLVGHKIDAADAEAKRKGIEAKYAEELEKAKVNTEKARGSAQRASASASSARAGYYNRGGSGGNKHMTLTIEGKTYTYDTKEDYERAVMRYAKQYGVDTTEDVETTDEEFNGRDGKSKGKKKRTTRKGRDVSKIAGDVEELANMKKKSSPTAGGTGGSGGKKSPTA